ncbi:CHAT domain-containing protein [Lignipirellula cremea]|uniref:CHAT domain protein n=1 Tax=Lignipirellula cremea TaxID=2528010 RepID=A0A518DRN1_9BACT|nr:CHAT domain-containing protein [Lignipirellula cremea]QDU94489.1 CHAT domain protein [Lignipirellula cremea]
MKIVTFVSLLLVCGLLSATLYAQSATQGVLVQVRGDRLEVTPLNDQILGAPHAGSGLIIWSHEGQERWVSLTDGRPPAVASLVSTGVRSGGVREAGAALVMESRTLDQLLGVSVVRGAVLLTPSPNARLLNGRVTFRRRPSDQGEFPEATAEIVEGNRVVARLAFPQGQQTLKWDDIPGLPGDIQEGLAAGEYVFRYTDGTGATPFVVEDDEVRDWVWERPDELAQLLGSKAEPTYRVVAVEHLLSQLDENQRPLPYLADALDLIEATPEARRTAWMQAARETILARLSSDQKPADQYDASGIEVIDKAQLLIASSRWSEARETLNEIGDTTDLRTLGLAAMYQAVIRAESTAALVAEDLDDAERRFSASILALSTGYPADAFRARVNFGNYLVNRAQNRLYNHAVQAATGVRSPLVHAILDWQAARTQYEAALQLADNLPPRDLAAVQANLARLYALADDLLASLGDSPAEDASSGARKLAQKMASNYAKLASTATSAEPIVRAAAQETFAHLAYRSGDNKQFRRAANQALSSYAEAGSLAGLESCHRSLGLFYQHAKKRKASEPNSKTALTHYRIAALIGEMLRERIDNDQEGMSRAGFFARRAYVNEQLMELLIEQGRYREALGYAELAKARSLQDVLIHNGIHAAAGHEYPLSLDDELDNWPADTVGLEYYLGETNCWVFVVSAAGRVHAERLVGQDGKPLSSSQLIADVHRYLAGTRSQAAKLYKQAMSGEGFDKGWQIDLHQFYQSLMPAKASAAIAGARNLVLVPHHILHYFPFAALVVEVDGSQRGALEMPQPKFLIDTGSDITYAPSLVSWGMLRERSAAPLKSVNAVGIVDFQSATRLPGVEIDLENLHAAFGDRLGPVLEGPSVSETRVRQLLKTTGMLFVATHGMNVADRPLTSFLLCHSDAEDDGRLTAAEIYAADVNAGLVVMSACFSGLADRTPMAGDDLFGLQRAFLRAGANTVVSGLWDVYDGTGPLLMRSFFEKLNDGDTAVSALASAQRDFLAGRRRNGPSDPWIHPYFWAVYTSAGSDTCRLEPANRPE